MKPKNYGKFEDPELEKEWKKMIELARKTNTHVYP